MQCLLKSGHRKRDNPMSLKNSNGVMRRVVVVASVYIVHFQHEGRLCNHVWSWHKARDGSGACCVQTAAGESDAKFGLQLEMHHPQ